MKRDKKLVVFIITAIIAPFWCIVLALALPARLPSSSPWLSTILWGGLVLVVFWLCLELSSLLVRFQSDGIAFYTLRGRELLPWSKISSLQVVPPLVIIRSPDKQVLLLLTFHRRPDDVIQAIAEKVPPEARVE